MNRGPGCRSGYAASALIAAGIAGYFWYRELTAKKRGDTRTVGRNKSTC